MAGAPGFPCGAPANPVNTRYPEALAPQLACALLGLLSPSLHLFGQVPSSLGLLRVLAVLRGLNISFSRVLLRQHL